ncbi:MAG: hypothetical protein R2712_21405 [Vicinamibacterales bacterium]
MARAVPLVAVLLAGVCAGAARVSAGAAGQVPLVEPPATADVRALLAGHPCATPVLAALDDWSAASAEALAEPGGLAGTRAIRMPTGTIGVWVRVTRDAGGALSIERIMPAAVETTRFDRSCASSVSRRELRASDDAAAFTDERLAARLARGDRGVILVWSPHMPLSVDEFAELETATARLGLAFEAVLDPAAEPGYASRVAGERQLPAGALRTLASIELTFRGMTTHAPSVQVFADGRLVGPVLFGYRDRETAQLSIARVLRAGRP